MNVNASHIETLQQALDAASQTDRGITYLENSDLTLDTRVTYAQLQARALRVLSELQKRGLEPGAAIVFQLESNQAFVEGFWACLLGGFLPIPINAGTTDEHLLKAFRILEQTESPTLITQGRIPERLWEYSKRQGIYDKFVDVFESAIDMEQIAADGPNGEVRAAAREDIASLQYSSGSTGSPKGVVLTHQNLLADIESLIQHCSMTNQDSHLSWVPLTHDLGMVMYHLLPIVLGVDQYLMPATRFARRPLAWLEAASHHRATILCSPNFGYQHFLKSWKKQSELELDLSAVRLIINGAEPISKPLVDDFMATLAPSGLRASAMWPCWGLAEATAGITIKDPLQDQIETLRVKRESLRIGEPTPYAGTVSESAFEVVCVGIPVPNSTLSIRNDLGEELPSDHYGHVYVQGPMVSPGYYGQTLAEPGNWLDTGDQGFISDGSLYVLGRSKDTIIVNGVNYHPNDLERACCDAAGFDQGKITFCSVVDEHTEKVVAFVVHRQSLEDFEHIANTIRQTIVQQTQIDIDHVLPIKTMPKTTSGKVQRFQLQARFLDGEFDAIIQEISASSSTGASPSGEIEQLLLAAFNEIIPEKQISLTDNIVEAGVSSLSLAEVAEYVDEIYPDLLELSDFLEHPTIPELAAHIEKATS